ncbi:glycoside hydrolase [Tricholoma matsutake]|nr:glycoside hydrolase [Tricholoma matsutake 945]
MIAAAIAIPVALTARKTNGTSPANGSSPSNNSQTSGKSGSRITLEDGTSFTYTNNFGGDWAADPKTPFAVGGKAQSWSKRIGTEDWIWGTDIARVTEPFICPALYEKYINSNNVAVTDEWTLSIAMGVGLAKEMEAHYSSFIVTAGLNWVRIPIGFWAIEAINNEPFLVGTSWTYFLKAIQWARKYGIRIYLDLHALPGSQNGWVSPVSVELEAAPVSTDTVRFTRRQPNVSALFHKSMHGTMGIANAQRTLTYLRIITQFVSQDQYRDVVGIVGIVNEILWATVGEIPVQSFYFAAYEAIRKSTGTGSGAGPYIAIHEGFQGPAIWEGFLAGADRIALDQHPYLAFTGDHSSSAEVMAIKPCAWAIATNQSQKAFGVTLGGEFSSAINDCGLWLNGIGSSAGYPECAPWDNWSSYNATLIAALKQVTLASMDALQNFFFWTWKIGNSTVLGTSSSPLWHYKLGLQQGWIPQDPREAVGHCASVLGSSQLFDGTYAHTATGGPGAGTINPVQRSSHTFPPSTLSPSFSGAQMTLLPTYTATGKIKSLFAPTFTAAPSAVVGDGWNNKADSALAFVPVAGCQYPDAWNAVNATLPPTPCKGS